MNMARSWRILSVPAACRDSAGLEIVDRSADDKPWVTQWLAGDSGRPACPEG